MKYNYNDFVVLCLWFNRLGENWATTCANVYVQKSFIVKVVWFLNFCKKVVFWSLFLCHKFFGQFTGEENDINLRNRIIKTKQQLLSLEIGEHNIGNSGFILGEHNIGKSGFIYSKRKSVRVLGDRPASGPIFEHDPINLIQRLHAMMCQIFLLTRNR
uniref:Uncharacterized protein n=1 Tax=Glossina austeni TaxID=7395 RepID=A0A1A9VSP2_GLOAU